MTISRTDCAFDFGTTGSGGFAQVSHLNEESPQTIDAKSILTPDTLYGPPIRPHQHRSNSSTSTSDSTGSSLTSTLSMADDSSVTEMSPGSPPGSPMATPSVASTSVARSASGDLTASVSRSSSSFELSRPSTPGKRARNLKNLAVNTTGTLNTSRPMPAAVDTKEPDQMAPRWAVSSMRRAPTPPRRKASKVSLTIVTPASTALGQEQHSMVPPTPSQARPAPLRHFQSSPSLPSISAYDESRQALTHPSLSRPILERAQSDLMARQDEEDPNFDIPQSREEKPEAYPDGPICVFDPYIDLYLEPTAEQATKYDVIMNVASEVRNPFGIYSQPDPTAQDNVRLDGGGGLQYVQKRHRQVSEASNDDPSALTSQKPKLDIIPASDTLQTVTTGVPAQPTQPEYIHIPWEHNTDIVADLVRLVKVIDDRVRQGKRVLIHCQCGVSRSATLVVAYCMYVHPEYSVQQAYDIVKRRSKWIGPNMNLIMQLQEFSSRTALGASRRTVGPGGMRSLTPVEGPSSWNSWRHTVSGSSLENHAPKTAPLHPARSETDSHSDDRAIPPAPSSAPPVPSELSWPMTGGPGRRQVAEERSDGRALSVPDSSMLLNVMPGIGFARSGNNEKPRPRSLRFDSSSVTPIPELNVPTISPRSEEFAMTALRPSAETSPEDRYGLMSPSTSSFSHNPLDRDALLGALGMSGPVSTAMSAKRTTQNFSFPFRRNRIVVEGPSVLEVATGTYSTAPQRRQDDLPVERTLLGVPKSEADGLPKSPRAFTFTQSVTSGSDGTANPAPVGEPLDGSDPHSPSHQEIHQEMQPLLGSISGAS